MTSLHTLSNRHAQANWPSVCRAHRLVLTKGRGSEAKDKAVKASQEGCEQEAAGACTPVPAGGGGGSTAPLTCVRRPACTDRLWGEVGLALSMP